MNSEMSSCGHRSLSLASLRLLCCLRDRASVEAKEEKKGTPTMASFFRLGILSTGRSISNRGWARYLIKHNNVSDIQSPARVVSSIARFTSGISLSDGRTAELDRIDSSEDLDDGEPVLGNAGEPPKSFLSHMYTFWQRHQAVVVSAVATLAFVTMM